MTLAPLPLTELGAGQRLLDRFVIQRELGRGGYSVVYAALDQEVGTEVALKFLVPPPAAAHEAKERLRREVTLVRGLRHPNIVGIHDYIEDGALTFLVMDLIDGMDLATLIATRGRLDAEATTRIGREIGTALAAAHREGILHRDIKPANILVDRTGRALLTDFGSARIDSQTTMTRTGGITGTVAYLAPEIWLGGRPDARTDLYALGVTLFEALVGSLPSKPSAHLPPTPEPAGFRPAGLRPELPPWLDQIVAMTTMADPRHRFATAEQLVDTLTREAYPAQPMIRATLAQAAEPVAPPPISPVFWLMIGAIVIVGLMAGYVASPQFYLATPVVAWLLVRSVRRDRTARTAAVDTAPVTWELIGPLAETQRALPVGAARSLLDDILVLARSQVDAAATPALAARWRGQLEPLISTAVQAASDLTEVDEALHRLEQTAGRVRHVPASFWESVTELERTRDGLSTIMLELVATLGRARGAAVDQFDSARFRLEEMVIDLKGDLGRTISAARELDASLRG